MSLLQQTPGDAALHPFRQRGDRVSLTALREIFSVAGGGFIAEAERRHAVFLWQQEFNSTEKGFAGIARPFGILIGPRVRSAEEKVARSEISTVHILKQHRGIAEGHQRIFPLSRDVEIFEL